MNKKPVWLVTPFLFATGTFAKAQRQAKVPKDWLARRSSRFTRGQEVIRRMLREIGYVPQRR